VIAISRISVVFDRKVIGYNVAAKKRRRYPVHAELAPDERSPHSTFSCCLETPTKKDALVLEQLMRRMPQFGL